MKGRRIAFSICFALALFVSLVGETFACACCAEPGHYKLRTAKIDSYYMNLISEFEFAPKARLYMTEAGFDTIEGLAPVRVEDEAANGIMSGDFDLAAAFLNKRSWRLDFKTPRGLKGTLTLPIPARATDYAVDIHDAEDQGLGPLLYKELRFSGGVASGTGFARAGITRGTTYTLVFQGRGRGCDEVSDFKNWRLDIHGPRAGYAFFGKLSSADKPQSE